MRLGLLAGEISGDLLAASLVAELAQRYPLELSGIGGPALTARGLHSSHPIDRLAVMGLIEPLKRLPELLQIRAEVFQQQLAWQPDVFVGVDSPDFNLALERRLKSQGITTAHLVSPSVWAWRQGRLKGIAKAVDLMMCLLPFELEIYQQAGIPAVHVGHPLIDDIAKLPDRDQARQELGIAGQGRVLAVMPGSRAGEVAQLLPLFLRTMEQLHRENSQLTFVIPAANAARYQQITAALANSSVPVQVTEGEGRLTLQASDAVLLASGTASLEAMLLRKPMVIAYRMAWMSWQIMSRMVQVKHVGLPNILAGRAVVPELLQEQASVDALTRAMEQVLERGHEQQLPIFDALADQIGGNFAERCADAIDGLVSIRR